MVIALPIIDRDIMTHGIAAVGDEALIKSVEKELVADIRSVIDTIDEP